MHKDLTVLCAVLNTIIVKFLCVSRCGTHICIDTHMFTQGWGVRAPASWLITRVGASVFALYKEIKQVLYFSLKVPFNLTDLDAQYCRS